MRNVIVLSIRAIVLVIVNIVVRASGLVPAQGPSGSVLPRIQAYPGVSGKCPGESLDGSILPLLLLTCLLL